MAQDDVRSARQRWAQLRFSVIGPLLASPPEHGDLHAELERLCKKRYRHPTTGESVCFGVSTLQRWYYQAKRAPQDPFGALRRKVHAQAGQHPSISVALGEALRTQYRQHPSWSYQLHYDNLRVLAEREAQLGAVPGYATVRRFMKSQGMLKRRRRKKRREATDDSAFVMREVRSFEVSYVHGLWHSDFHVGSRRVLTEKGQYNEAVLFGALDDRSRLCCHLQWYWAESAETFCHGLSQAVLKHGLPRALLTDNGGAMTSAEATEGLLRLGIVHHTTLPYTPEQNAKQESFWGQVEGRLLPMLEGQRELTLGLLNEATQAWVQLEYHHRIHSEIGQTPLQALLAGPTVARPSPASETLRRAFAQQQTRTQRRSDGTLTVQGVRFEVPSRYRTLLRPTVRFCRWDLSSIELIDAHTDKRLCVLYPGDKRQNAEGRRRSVESAVLQTPVKEPDAVAPLLQKLMADYAQTGLPPAYLPLHPNPNKDPSP